MRYFEEVDMYQIFHDCIKFKIIGIAKQQIFCDKKRNNRCITVFPVEIYIIMLV